LDGTQTELNCSLDGFSDAHESDFDEKLR